MLSLSLLNISIDTFLQSIKELSGKKKTCVAALAKNNKNKGKFRITWGVKTNEVTKISLLLPLNSSTFFIISGLPLPSLNFLNAAKKVFFLLPSFSILLTIFDLPFYFTLLIDAFIKTFIPP